MCSNAKIYCAMIVVVFAMDLSADDSTAILNLVPESEKQDFLVYHIAKGCKISEAETDGSNNASLLPTEQLNIPMELVDKFESMDIPANFSINLYHWTKDNFNHSEPQVPKLAARSSARSSEVCFPDRSCINIRDVSAYCCPF